MSKHRIKNVSNVGDYDDGYDEDEEYDAEEQTTEDTLTAEDREKLRVGTAQVRTALGHGFPSISDKEIQDTLWHYYYDVAKSVTYLKNKHLPTRPKQEGTKLGNTGPRPPELWIPRLSEAVNVCHLANPTAKNFFHDAPWLKVPSYRKAEILVEPRFPRLGLLGGSSAGEGKMSKIAALAAKRRQKENEKEKAPNVDNDVPTLNPTPSLDKLKIATKATTYSLKARSTQLDQRRESSPLPKQITEPSPIKNSIQPSQQKETIERTGSIDEPEDRLPGVSLAELRATPSTFARILVKCGDGVLSSPSELPESLPESVVSAFDFSKPSPDDVVLKAQNFKATGSIMSTPVKEHKSSKPKGTVNEDMKELSIVEPVKIKSKNFDVPAEYRKTKRKNAANFVVIGHVDSGKSTLMGRLLFDLKAIDERTVEKYRREAEKMGKGSFAFAWVMDHGTEERARGVTMDIAMQNFETDRTAFTILDAPGHRDFVPNMIAGASQADFAILVIDASPAEFEAGLLGQTKEHALLVRSIGISKVIVAVNKMDRAEWLRERFQEIQQQMMAFLTTAGFDQANISFVPCSGLEGDNILNRSVLPQANWYSGNTLVEELDTSEPINRALDEPLRMTIGDVFSESTQNPLSISGRIEAGSLQVGDQVLVMPSGEKFFIRSVQVDQEPSDWAVAGQNVSLSITEIDLDLINEGDMLCSVTSPVNNVSEFMAKVLAFDYLTPMPLDIQRGRLRVPGKISRLVAVLDKADGSLTKKKPKIVHPGSIARVVVSLDSPAPIEGGRVVFRASGETVAAGLLE